MSKIKQIPIIDLFAGPGGLGEGFSSVYTENMKRVFDIKLSIEKNEYAHQTLRLRSFYRKFPKEKVPKIYYQYIEENDKTNKNIYFKQLKEMYSKEWEAAEKEAWGNELPFKQEIKIYGNKEETIGYSTNDIEKKHREIDQKISNCLKKDENFVLIGGPPCQAYSLVGRSRNQGISSEDHRVHLYKEYLRIIAKHHPAIFVMENVKGLLSAKVNGKEVFSLIKKDLENPNSVFKNLNSPKYKIFSFVKSPDYFTINGFPRYKEKNDYLIKSENYGVPQNRHRVILLGIREDLKYDGEIVLNRKPIISLRTVIDDIPKIRSGISREIIGKNEKGKHKYKKIENTKNNWIKIVIEHFRLVKKELKLNDDINFKKVIDTQGANFIYSDKINQSILDGWYYDPQLNGLLNHESRTHLKEDLARYLFSSLYLKEKKDFPKLRDYPKWLLPEHKNVMSNKFADRFRTQKPDQPATTVTSHISKDGHYFIHYDPQQCRSLTVREAARIQTFPDNYYFCGSRTHQYHQVGNAVPPYLAKQLAEIVNKIFINNIK